MPTWNDRLPFLDDAEQIELPVRFDACAESIAKALGVTKAQFAKKRLYGCGMFGCAWHVPGLPADRDVLKVTGDNLEAHTAQILVEHGDAVPDGIVRYAAVYRLGNCSVLPGAGLYRYWNARNKRVAMPDTFGRPLWLLHREGLPDPKHRMSPPLRSWLSRLVRVLSGDAYHALNGRLGTQLPKSFAFYDETHRWASARTVFARPGSREPSAETKKHRGEALVEALYWLLDKKILLLDFDNVDNLGWRERTGLVLRDVGLSSTPTKTKRPPAALGGFVSASGLGAGLF